MTFQRRILFSAAVPILCLILMSGALTYTLRCTTYYSERANFALQQIATLEQIAVELDGLLVNVLLAQDPRPLMKQLETFEHDSLQQLGVLDNQTRMELSFVEEDEREEEAEERDRPAALRQQIETLLDQTQRILTARLSAEPTLNRANDLEALLQSHKNFGTIIRDALSDENSEIAEAEEMRTTWQTRQKWIVALGVLLSAVSTAFIAISIVRDLRAKTTSLRATLETNTRSYGKATLKPEQDELDQIAAQLDHLMRAYKNAEQNAEQERTALSATLERRSIDLELSNARLREIDQTRRRFLGDIGHALKTPLAVARGSVENLTQTQDTDSLSSLNRALRSIDAVGERVAALVALARSDDGQLIGQLQDVELYEFLDQRLNALRILPGGERFTLNSYLLSPAQVCCDPRDLERLFDALLENALDHSGTEKPISIDLEATEGIAQVHIRDHGAGAGDKTPDEMFQRYSSGSDGHGIGLAMARQIATDLGGQISLSSPNDGGFQVSITLPLKGGKDGSSDC